MAKPTRKRKPKAAAPPLEDRVIDAAFALIEASGWRNLALADVAAAAEAPLADLLIPFPTKYHIINAYQERIDAQMLQAAGADGDGGDARDRLFDLLMERLDALTPRKAAMAEIAKDSIGDPGAVCFLPRMSRSMSRALEAAGIPAGGIEGRLKAKGLALIYADAFRVWLKDDTKDQSKTMAALDRGLRRADAAMQRLRKFCRPATPSDENAPAK